MPNLKEMLELARKEESKIKPKVIKGIRPDRILRGEIELPSLVKNEVEKNVELSQPERSQQPGKNVARTVAERSQKIENVELSQPERSQQPGKNVARTVAERSQQPGKNVAIKNDEFYAAQYDPTLLVGVQRKVFDYLLNLTQRFASLITPKLTLESMAAATELTEWQVHSATKSLRKKGLVQIAKRKDGRGGWIEYSIPSFAFDAWIKLENHHKRSQNGEETQPKRSQQPGYKPGHEAPSSSSYSYISNKTTTSDALWQEIDLSPLDELIGLTKAHIEQIIQRKTLKPEQVQESIASFAFDLVENGKGKSIKSPLNYFMGVLNKGGYVPPENYEAPQDKAFRLIYERKKARAAKAAAIEKELLEMEYEEWLKTITPESRASLVPENQFAKLGGPGHAAMLKEYFYDKVWPEKKAQMMRGDS